MSIHNIRCGSKCDRRNPWNGVSRSVASARPSRSLIEAVWDSFGRHKSDPGGFNPHLALPCRDHWQLSYLGTPHGKLKAYLTEMMNSYFQDLHAWEQLSLQTCKFILTSASIFLAPPTRIPKSTFEMNGHHMRRCLPRMSLYTLFALGALVYLASFKVASESTQ